MGAPSKPPSAVPSAGAETTADRVRRIAERVRQLPYDVRTAFEHDDPSKRVQHIRDAGMDIMFEFLPFLSWIERRRSPEAARIVQQRVDHVLRGAVECAAVGVPKPTMARVIAHALGFLSEGMRKAGELFVHANVVAAFLDDWANDIELEDAKRWPGNEREHENQDTADQRRRRGRRPLSETDPPRFRLYSLLNQVSDEFGGPKSALPHLRTDPKYKQILESVKDIGETLDEKLMDAARQHRETPGPRT
jgi:hypothetical protein